jgi:hypothetical protein
MTILWLLLILICVSGPAPVESASGLPPRPIPPLFVTNARCLSCHNGLVTPSGRDVSIGSNWQASMMANASRDPYWHAAVRRETMEQVQIYEAIMVTAADTVTTGLLSAIRYVKDNRILPRGFDKKTAVTDIAVQGRAESDADFRDSLDVMSYAVAVERAQGPFTVVAELWYQPIAYRWAQNLKAYAAPETERFVALYDAMSSDSAILLARDSKKVP